jgi:hypothetical protein
MRLATIGLALGVFVAGIKISVLQAQPAPPPMPPELLSLTNATFMPAGTNAAVTQAATNAAPKPKIQFATPIYDFGKVKVNEPVKCDFVFTNTGQALLDVTGVHPGCGCTTAGSWTRQVEPGKTGTIPIQFNAAGAPGPFGKTITVSCNDPSQPTVILQIKGVLWKPVEVNPPYAVFNVTADSVSNATAIVRIINNEETPLTLSAPESNSRVFAAELGIKQPGKEFEVVVRPVPPLEAASTQGLITLKTSSTNLPVININTTVILAPTLVANPATIMIPSAPNTNNVRPVIHIRNNGSGVMKLSDPVVNAQGVAVQIQEIEPGRFASVTLTFPPDFTIPPGEKIELKIKTGLAHLPTFEVPLFQRPPAAR